MSNNIEVIDSPLFEIEVVQEIWRTPDLTFVVVYPTHKTAAIKGMRGRDYTLKERREIKRIMTLKGISKVIFERKIDDEFYEKEVINNAVVA